MILEILILILLAPVILMNALGPLVVYRSQRLPARIELEPVAGEEARRQAGETFAGLDDGVRALGFDYVGSALMKDSQTRTWLSLYVNEDDLSSATVVAMKSEVKSITYVEFAQRYADESMLDVNNSDQTSAFPKMGIQLAVRYPDVRDPAELFRIFRALRASLHNSAEPIAYRREEGFRPVEEFIARESDILVERGYCKPEIGVDGRRALTLKGAFLMTWRIAFPGSFIRGWREKVYARRLLEQAL